MNVSTPDGRTLRLHLAGADDGFPVVVHHGTPGSGVLYARWVAEAAEAGVRLIGYDRPGYGGSTRRAGRSVADAAADVRAIAAALGIARLATWGISGGGPHALACAALAPDLVVAAACIAGPVPYGVEGIDYLEGMGEANVEEFSAALAGERALRPLLERDAAEMTKGGAAGMKRVLTTLLSPVDEAAANGPLGDYVYESMELGLRPGVDGWVDDDLAFVAAWGFDVGAIDVAVLLLQGAHDRFVPASHARWLAARLPAAEARLEPDDGHLTLGERRIGAVHDWLLRTGVVVPRG